MKRKATFSSFLSYFRKGKGKDKYREIWLRAFLGPFPYTILVLFPSFPTVGALGEMIGIYVATYFFLCRQSLVWTCDGPGTLCRYRGGRLDGSKVSNSLKLSFPCRFLLLKGSHV